MAKKTSKKRFLSKLTYLKQPKAIIALVFIIVFAGIGVKQLTPSLAATTIPYTFYPTYPSCTPLCHTTGYWAGAHGFVLNGTNIDVYTWGWPNGSLKDPTNYAYQTSHFLQWGPYPFQSVYIPSNMHGLRVCINYAGWGLNNDGSGYLWLQADVNYYGRPASNANTWYAGENELQGPGLFPIMQSRCYNYPLKAATTYKNVEFRLKVLATTDKDAQLDLWRTTVKYY